MFDMDKSLAKLNPILHPAEISADWETITNNVNKMIEPYKDVTPEVAASMDLKEAKICCADLRRISKELNDGRKAIKKIYNEPLKAFEDKCKEIDKLINAPLAIIDEAVKIQDNNEREARRQILKEAYEDYAPVIADMVDFDRICEREWLNKSFGEKKAQLAMNEKVARIGADYQTLQKLLPTFNFPKEAEAEFWHTLSLREAQNFDDTRTYEEEKIKELHEQVQEVKQYQTKEKPQVYVLAVTCTSEQVTYLKDTLSTLGIHGLLTKSPLPTAQNTMDFVKDNLTSFLREE